jgi:acyl-CoA reductase-like NAD-dependent aldehyde dehydrogenase
MSSPSILQRRLIDVSERIKRLRSDLGVTEEQLVFLEGEAEDARMRALVSEARDARRHADLLARQRDSVVRSIADLIQEQDVLLDRLSSQLPAT